MNLFQHNRHGLSSIHVFLWNRLYLGHTDVTSFGVHFEKIGRGLFRKGKRREGEWAVWAKRGVMNSEYWSCIIEMNTAALSVIKNKPSVADCILFLYSSPLALPKQPTLPLSVYLPTITLVLFFQNAREMASRRCVPGRVDSAKKTMYTTVYILCKNIAWITNYH